MTENDINSMMNMQEEAKRRVMDMANRSRFAAEDMNRTLFSGNAAALPQNKGQEQMRAPAGGISGLSGLSREETEKMFILSLCLLLSQEGTDESVILGLMYLLT